MTQEDLLRTALEQIGDDIDQAIRLLEHKYEANALLILRSASAAAHELGNDRGGPQ